MTFCQNQLVMVTGFDRNQLSIPLPESIGYCTSFGSWILLVYFHVLSSIGFIESLVLDTSIQLCGLSMQNLPVEHYEYTYGGWWSVWWMGSYSMVLSKAAFIHQKYLELYTHDMPASVRNYVTNKRLPSNKILHDIYLVSKALDLLSYSCQSFSVMEIFCSVQT